MDVACPLKPTKIIDKNNPWWNEELQDKRKHLSKLYKKKNRHPTEYNIDKYKNEKRIFAGMCRRAQTRNWNEFLESTSDINEINALRKIFEGRQLEEMGTLMKPDGSIATPGIDTLETLINAHFKDGKDITPTIYPNISVSLTELSQQEYPWIREDLLELVFKGFASKKSPGTDKIKPIVYKNLTHEYISILVKIYRAMIF